MGSTVGSFGSAVSPASRPVSLMKLFARVLYKTQCVLRCACVSDEVHGDSLDVEKEKKNCEAANAARASQP